MTETESRARTNDVLRALRHATARHHASIETVVSLDRFDDVNRYVRILRGFDTFLQAWEPAIRAAVPAHLRDWVARRSRRHWLAQDRLRLDDRQVCATAPAVAELGRSLRCESAALGSLYVMEGSALGGQVISRRLAERLSLDPARGAAFFHGHGKATGAQWEAFKAVLARTVPLDADSVRRACDAACGTFDALEAQLRLCLFEDAAEDFHTRAEAQRGA